jgi:hypothetical protein
MEFKSRYFTIHMQDYCKDILAEPIEEMIIELSANAIFVMNTDMDPSITGRTAKTLVDLLKHSTFRYMPFHLVCEGFQKGSMGELGGTTRFTVRNVNTWMKAMNDKRMLLETERKTKEDARIRAEEAASYKRLQRSIGIYGTACYWKVAHSPLSDEEYDRLTLDKIVEAFKKGYSFKELTPSLIL